MTLVRMCNENSVKLLLKPIPTGEKVSKVIIVAAEAFANEAGLDPEFAFVKVIPQGADELVEVRGMILLRADWLPDGQVAVGRSGMESIGEKYRHWRKVTEVQNV